MSTDIGSEARATTLELETRESSAVEAALQQVHASNGRLGSVQARA